jgi:hypothetical protein
MTKFVLDSETAQKLRDAAQCIQLCDPTGATIGYFRPEVDPELYRTIKEPFTKEQLDRARNDPSGRPLKEIMRDLERLA